MKQVRDRAYLLGELLHQLIVLLQSFRGCSSEFFRLLREPCRYSWKAPRSMADAIVQVPGDAAALFILRRDQAGRKVRRS